MNGHLTGPGSSGGLDAEVSTGRLIGVDPEAGLVIREPERASEGYWVGAPGAFWDEATRWIYLTYRHRRPGHRPSGRGHTAVIARSRDGLHFEDVLAIHKSQLDTPSVERSCLRRLGDRWAYYFCYVDPADSRWRIDMVTSANIETLDVDLRQTVLTADGTRTEGIKDPFVFEVGPAQLMYASFAASLPMTTAERAWAHATGDIYARGSTTAPTGLATSLNGIDFDWQSTVFPVGNGWDRYQARLTSVVRCEGYFLALYDGSATVSENYEERAGLALSANLIDWIRLTPRRPLFESLHHRHSMRYTDLVTVDGQSFLYYEYARPDGSHDLRVLDLS